jgi:hypothetical protein
VFFAAAPDSAQDFSIDCSRLLYLHSLLSHFFPSEFEYSAVLISVEDEASVCSRGRNGAHLKGIDCDSDAPIEYLYTGNSRIHLQE